MRVSPLLLTLPILLAAGGPDAVAETAIVVGAPGLDGADGPGPGAAGAPGGAGEDATAVANAADPVNVAQPTGGNGGAGGDGASPAGAAGEGGGGGSTLGVSRVVFSPTTSVAADTESVAGAGGAGGRAAPGGQVADGGTGGNAHASAAVAPQAPGTPMSTNISADAVAVSRAGDGGDAFGTGATAGDGGMATVGARVEALDAPSAHLTASIEATGGSGGAGFEGADGGSGGDTALIDAAAAVGSGPLTMTLDAVGGSGGSSEGGTAGRGGNATIAQTWDSQGSSARAAFQAMAGRAGQASDGGAAAAGDAVVDAVVRGASLSVSTLAAGGSGAPDATGTVSGASGGAASVNLTIENLSGLGYIEGVALGGDGGAASGVGQTGGAGGQASASLDFTGDTALRSLTVVGGAGGPGLNGADGGAAADIDAVEGVSVQSDSLGGVFQRVHGGRGGSTDGSAPGLAADGGRASSTLNLTNPGLGGVGGNIAALGGAGGFGPNPTNGGDAHLRVRAIDEQDVSLQLGVLAGPGVGGFGGTATLGEAYGQSTGGGRVIVDADVLGGQGLGDAAAGTGSSVAVQDVVDGETTGILSLRQAALGADAHSFGMAGAATSRLARQKAAASLGVTAEARAGAGGTSLLGQDGGPAVSEAMASNLSGAAFAAAIAAGGDAVSGSGGDAHARAEAVASGSGVASATATASAGTGHHRGEAAAVAIARAANAIARASSDAPGGPFERLSANALASVGDVARAEVHTVANPLSPIGTLFEPGVDVAMELAPDDTDALRWGEASMALQHDHPGHQQSIVLETSLRFVLPRFSSTQETLAVSFLGSEIRGAGFDELRFRLEDTPGQVTLFERVFSDPTEAAVFFAGTFNFGSLLSGLTSRDFSLALEFTTDDPGAGFGLTLGLFSVPEPGTALLVALGLLMLARNQPRTRTTSASRPLRRRPTGRAVRGGRSRGGVG